MKQLHQLYQDVLTNGTRQANRTGTDAISIPGAMMRFDMQDGFPATTTKQLAFKACKGELIGFLNGYTSAADFRALGCNIWDQNANENKQWLDNPNRKGEDDLGRIYGAQWRDLRGANGVHIDQLDAALFQIRHNPTNRRIIIDAWTPTEFDKMALPPCHVLYQFIVNVERKELNLCMYQRSCDSFLGVPFNVASASMFLHLMAAWSGLTPRLFTHFLADAHIYVNHLDQVKEQLSREPYQLPRLEVNVPADSHWAQLDFLLRMLAPKDLNLVNYQHHPAIKAPMAV